MIVAERGHVRVFREFTPSVPDPADATPGSSMMGETFVVDDGTALACGAP